MTESVPQEDTQPEKLPEEVFHYTSLDTLIKIVETRELWCTALPYLNDSKERTFIFDAVKHRLPYLKETDNSIDPDLGLRTFEAEDVNNVTSFADEAFVACFAQNSDSLLHWRAYCPQQSGVAIGFRARCLAEAHISGGSAKGMILSRVAFGKVKYLDTRNTEVIDRVVYFAYESAKREVARDKTSLVLNDHFRWALDYIGCISKEKSFEGEDEWRLLLPYVRSREDRIRFRTVRSTIIPYVAMTVPNLTETGIMHDLEKPWNAIQSVVIGPTANMDLTARSLRALFALRGMNVQIVESRVPYRDW
jgi:Protein of unknown function (DUF2971)